jgi:hypothetical protein
MSKPCTPGSRALLAQGEQERAGPAASSAARPVLGVDGGNTQAQRLR